MIHLPQFFFKMSVSNEIRLVNKQGVLSYCVVDSSNVAMSGCTVNSINNLPDFVYEFSLKGIDLSKKYVDLNYKNDTLFINDEPIKNMVGTVRNVKKMSLEFPNHINIRKDVFKAELKQWSKNSAIIIGTDIHDNGTLLINNREVTESIRVKKDGISVYSNEYLLEYLNTIPDDVRLYIDYDLNYPMQIKFMPEKAEYKGYDNFFILAPRVVGYRESPWDFVIPAKKKKEYVPLKLKPGEQQIKFKIPFDPNGRNLTFIETSYDLERALTNNVHYIVFSFVRRVKNRRRIIYGAYDRKRKIIAYNDSNYDDSGKNLSTSSLFNLLNNLPFDTYYDCKKYNIYAIKNIIDGFGTIGTNEEFINNRVSRLIYGVYFKGETPQQKEEVKEMTAKKTNTYGDLNSVKKEIERIYSQIGALEKERAKWDKMGDKKRVKYYDDLIKDNEHKIKTFQKVISDVEKMEKKTKKTPAKKTSAKKTSGTPRTKGLHQTGTQTLEGRKMDLKIKAELPGKRTSATGKTYYEYRVNRTDMPAERLDFDKNFHRVYARDDPKLSSLSDIKQEIKTQKHSLEFYKEKREHCKRFDAKDEVKKFDKWIGQTKDRLEVLEKELKERKEKKTAAKKTPAKTPAKASSGTSKKTAEAIKAELYSTKISLDSDKRHLMRLNELLHNYEVEKARWERMGDKRRVQYNENLIKETKEEILKYKTKIIPALEKEFAKLEKEKKELEIKKTSGTPAKKKASGTASASKTAKKKQVKPKTRKTSKTQKTLF